jgi:hypothetical protein
MTPRPHLAIGSTPRLGRSGRGTGGVGRCDDPGDVFPRFWAALAAAAFVVLGIETKGRSIEEIDAALTKPALAKAPLGPFRRLVDQFG